MQNMYYLVKNLLVVGKTHMKIRIDSRIPEPNIFLLSKCYYILKRHVMRVVLINDGSLLLLPDALICQVGNICVVPREAVQHQCECHVHVLDIMLWNLFHFDGFIVLRV